MDFDINNVFQLGLAVGVPSIMMFMFVQIRGWMKDSHKQQVDNRTAITTEIKTSAEELLKNVEARLDSIKVAAVYGKDELVALKGQITELRKFVDELDKEGTVEWQKTKPFIVDKIEMLAKRIDELEKRFIIEVTDLKQDNKDMKQDNKEMKKEHERRG